MQLSKTHRSAEPPRVLLRSCRFHAGMLLRTIHLVSDTCLGPVPCFLYSEANRSFSTCKHLSQASTSQFLSKTQTKKHFLKNHREPHFEQCFGGECCWSMETMDTPISQFVKVPLRHCSQRFSWVHEMQSLSQASHVRPTWFTPEGYVPDRRGQRWPQSRMMDAPLFGFRFELQITCS